MPDRRFLAFLLLPFVFALVAACGGDDDDDDGGETPTGTAETVDDGSGEGEGPVAVGEADGLGPVLTTADGLTLYIFTNDPPLESTCYDACASTWPPLLTEDDEVAAPEGVEGALSVVPRTDGTKQVALDGAPLYTFTADSAPGSAVGHGSGGVWFAASPDGAQASVPETTGSAAPVDPYYD